MKRNPPNWPPGEKEEEHTSALGIPTDGPLVAAAAVGWGMAWKAYRNADKGYVEPIAAARRRSTTYPAQQILRRRSLRLRLHRTAQSRRCASGRDGPRGSVMVGRLARHRWHVNGAGWLTRFAGTVSGLWDKWIIDGLMVNGPAVVSRILSYPARMLQWGLVQWYALVMVRGLVGSLPIMHFDDFSLIVIPSGFSREESAVANVDD